MTAAFTPGPWDYDSTDFDVYDMESGESLQITEANAQLIAAAPDLLAALQGFINHGTCFDEQDMKAACAAIAKATGAAA